MLKEKKKNYIEPEEFFAEVLESRRHEKASNKLGEMFMTLSERFCNHPNFVRYKHLREDMISTGAFACLKAFPKFSPYNKLGTLIKMGEVVEKDNEYEYTIKGTTYRFRFQDLTIKNEDGNNETMEHINDIYKLHKHEGTLYGWDGEQVTYDYKTCYNPHAFFTMVISNSFKQLLKKEYNQKNIFNKMCIQNNLDPDYGYLDMIKEQEEKERGDNTVDENYETDEEYEGKIDWG